MAMMNKGKLTERFDQALIFTAQLHANQVRKGTDIPYLAHLLAVSSLVLEDGGDENQAIAALLHDAAEDQGGIETLNKIRQLFGEKVAEIVDGCTDTYENPKPPWRGRKEKYIQHLQEANQDILRVSLADKIHNARSILADLRINGAVTWTMFNGGKNGTLWYYRELVKSFKTLFTSPMVGELAAIVKEIETIASQDID